MSNNKHQTEEQAAAALDQYITELQRGPAKPTNDSAMQLSHQLSVLAEEVQPHPQFEKQLRAQLLTQAHNNLEQKQQSSLPQQIAEGIRRIQMKRLFTAAAGLTAVLVIGFFGWWYIRTQPLGTEPQYGISALPADGSQQNVDIAQSGSDTDSAATNPVEGQVMIEEAASSSIMMDRRGGGGYGYGPGEGPFTNATLTLNATLPTDGEAAVFTLPAPYQPGNIDQERLRTFAQQMGVEGDIYFEWYQGMPIDGIDDGSGNVPYAYRIFDGKKMVTSHGGGEMGYENTALFQNQYQMPPLPYAERAAIAEQFLQERGLLDFEYEMRQSWGTEVQFFPLYEGKPLQNWATINVNVIGDGQIAGVWLRPLLDATGSQTEPLRTADEAWAFVQENFQSGQMMHNIIPTNPAYYGPPISQQGQKTHWEQEYAVGQEVTLNSWIQIYRPADGSITPRMITHMGLVLVGEPGELEAIANTATNGNNIRLTGTIIGEADNLQLQVTGWEAITGPSDIYLTGTTRQIDGKMVLELPGGFPIEIANPPADLPADQFVSMSSWGVRVADDGVSAVTDWVTLDLANHYGPPQEEPPFEDPYFNITDVTIDNVQLGYFYLHPFEPFPYSNEPYARVEASHLIPVWRFVGQTNKGDMVEFTIPALTSIELPEPIAETEMLPDAPLPVPVPTEVPSN